MSEQTTTAAPLRRWAIRWTQPNGVTGLGDGYDDHEHAVAVLHASRDLYCEEASELLVKVRRMLLQAIEERR